MEENDGIYLDCFDWMLIAFAVSCLQWVVIGTIALAVMG